MKVFGSYQPYLIACATVMVALWAGFGTACKPASTHSSLSEAEPTALTEETFKEMSRRCGERFLASTTWAEASQFVSGSDTERGKLQPALMESCLQQFRGSQLLHERTLQQPATNGPWVSTWRTRNEGGAGALTLIIDQSGAGASVRASCLVQQALQSFAQFVQTMGEVGEGCFYASLTPAPVTPELPANTRSFFIRSSFDLHSHGNAAVMAFMPQTEEMAAQWHIMVGKADPLPPQARVRLSWRSQNGIPRVYIDGILPDGWGDYQR